MEKYIVTIYQKVDLSDNTIVFKRIGLAQDVTIVDNDGIEEITFLNEKNEEVTLGYMENEYVMISDEDFCFGYPITLSDLKNQYPECETIDELTGKYFEEISKVVNIGYYDDEKDKVKILFTNEDYLKCQDEDTMFRYFTIEYASMGNEKIVLPISDIKQIHYLLQKRNYKVLREKIEQLNISIDQLLGELDNDESLQKMLNKEANDDSIDSSLNKLDELIGLENIKKEVNKLVKYLIFRDKTNKYLNLEPINLSMFFTGNPGTGKTTVAKIIGEILYKLGYSNEKFVEITPKDLIAGYVGQTALKTSKVLKENEGGVVFIDEAYVLSSEGQEFAEEALTEILKELEKKKTVFIFAGYKKEMDDFIRMNSGLTSRIGYYLDYQDYNTDQLYQIFESKITKMGFIIDDKIKEKIIENINKAKNNEHFGNGRYIDKLIDKLILEHAINVENKKRKDKLITITEKDYTPELEETLLYKVKTKKMGF